MMPLTDAEILKVGVPSLIVELVEVGVPSRNTRPTIYLTTILV